ncbi:NAD(P)H-dependent oxidoreductase [Chromohalobacter israelensis]|uniref:NAD(P)H-dependent oxidoreductase n=1 Tax=Chromohalobacter israelensis TaxID=141390 RepID=UPI0015C4C5BA|nr:NAD(P)H-dependent oxidoreductase [Chromohalobacter salexigens]NWO55447.1 flavodoxin family protein [Chromohalobacter salexigens]
MNILIVHSHPEPRSFNAALTDIAMTSLTREGHEVHVSDLYAEGFDPVERASHFESRADPEYFSALTEQRHHVQSGTLPCDVQREIDRLQHADLVILQFPLWWHAQPAMLKGWFDRVFVYGGLYSGTRRYDRGPLQGKRAMCSVTTGAPEPTFSPTGRSGDIVSLMWPLHCSLYYVGFDVLPPQITYGVQGGGLSYQEDAAFQCHLEDAKQQWSQRLRHWQTDRPIPFTGWQDWNAQGETLPEHPLRWRI